MIGTGHFNTKVMFLESVRTANSFGARGKREYNKVFSCYGYISHFRNSEFWENKTLQSKERLRLRIRYSSLVNLNTSMLVTFDEHKFYNVVSVENVLNRNREYLIYLETIKDDVEIVYNNNQFSQN